MLLAPVHDFRFYLARSAVFNPIRAFGSRSVGDGIIADPHQSPFGIKASGLPCRGETPGPWLLRAPENPQYPGLSKWSRSWQTASQVCGLPPAAVSNPVWAQDRGVSVKLSCSAAGGWDETAAESGLMVISQPRGELTVSARKPQVFMQTPCSRRTAPGRAECSSTPAPACAPRS